MIYLVLSYVEFCIPVAAPGELFHWELDIWIQNLAGNRNLSKRMLFRDLGVCSS
jgi:hypothetical protein